MKEIAEEGAVSQSREAVIYGHQRRTRQRKAKAFAHRAILEVSERG